MADKSAKLLAQSHSKVLFKICHLFSVGFEVNLSNAMSETKLG